MSKHEEREAKSPRGVLSPPDLDFSLLPGLQNFWRLPAPLLAAFIGRGSKVPCRQHRPALQFELSPMGACASDIRKQILIIQGPFTFLSKKKTIQVSSALIEPLSLRTSYVHVALFLLYMPYRQFISSLAELLRAACLSRHLLDHCFIHVYPSSSPLCLTHEPPQPGLSTFPRAARREVRINRV